MGWPASCFLAAVLKLIFKADGERSGFLRSAVEPTTGRSEPKFGPMDAVEVVVLVLGVLLLMRYLLH